MLPTKLKRSTVSLPCILASLLAKSASARSKTLAPHSNGPREDDFIDDTELAWEQQALMAKDGFFVFMGPLVPPQEKPAVER